jgi:hypothetical protein
MPFREAVLSEITVMIRIIASGNRLNCGSAQ